MSPRRVMLVILFVMLATTSFTPHTQVSFRTSPAASPFRLPIASGLRAYVIQGNNDTQHDHVGKAKYAFDFTVGTTNFVVTASQGGTVIGADDSSTTGCGDVGCWTQANYVVIADDDGKTAALYLHLLHNSLKVKLGMHVNQGDPLGQADTTGWATGPHLHFQVENIPNIPANPQQSPGWWWTQSVPVSFANPEVLAQDADGVPKYGQSFNVSNSPAVSSPPPTIYIGLLSYDQLLPFYPVDYDASTAGGTIFALNINNGSNRWYHTFDGNINAVAVSDGIAYMSENGNIYMFNISDGTLVRHFKVGDFIDPPVVVNGVIYVHAINHTSPSSESVFYALNTDGSQIWSYPTGPVGNRSSGETPVVVNNVLYASTEDGGVYALNTTTGSLLWHTQLDASDGSANLSSPTVLNGGVYVAGYSSGHLYALNADTGSVVWRSQYNSGGGIASLTASDGVLYISNDVSIYALRASDGNQLWHTQTDGHRNLLTAVGGVVYVTSSFPINPNADGSATYAFRASDGFMLWRIQTQAQAHQYSRVPEVVNGIVYVASDFRTGHNIDALHASDGTVIWESPIF
jgi:outer membrane protein assembly factor BamB